ncbi:hypothetical protein ZHAS_00018636 [Anopheles sinensis]|uniref:Uncharacterized protein n=1 Tax=Anopheles sinensis TaxID=74873 RepID=A0A084WJH0_ANOSI|nr:hypothetical protein ZHAS_00018636 [Anopheles sinensis]
MHAWKPVPLAKPCRSGEPTRGTLRGSVMFTPCPHATTCASTDSSDLGRTNSVRKPEHLANQVCVILEPYRSVSLSRASLGRLGGPSTRLGNGAKEN